MSDRDLPGRVDVVIVGAGSAGAVLAARLSERPDRSVLLLEAGPDNDSAHTPPAISGASFLQAMGEPGRIWPELLVQRTPEQGRRFYPRGRGAGGSSAVNAMVAMPGEPADYDEWERDLGCAGWGWSDVAPWFERLPIPLNMAGAHEIGPLSRALLTAEPTTEYALLTRDSDGRRASTNDVYLEPARGRDNLLVRGDSLVDRLLLRGRRSVGVRLADGTEIEAATVVVCAGAIHSPALLLRSAVQRAGIGIGLQDHPSFPIALRLHGELIGAADALAVSVLLRATHIDEHDMQLLAMDVADPAAPGFGVLMGAVMRVHSRGSVRLAADDPRVGPLVDMNMLDDERDVVVLRAAAGLAERVAAHPALSAIADVQPFDASEDGLRASVGDYVHAVGTCRMGATNDEAAVVDLRCQVIGYEGLLVCDASVMPRIPRANTHLPTVMIAERVAAMLAAGAPR